jgi:F0F1-type ATP synthase membrane subunit a
LAACATAIVVMLVAGVTSAIVVARRDLVHIPGQLKNVLPALTEFVEANRG